MLIVGLGNPGREYEKTRHNAGFIAMDFFAYKKGVGFSEKHGGLFNKIRVGDNEVFLLKPLTYMNLSGQAVVAVCRKFKIPTTQVIVFVDDIYLDIGTVRLKKSGGAGGHNGLKSINELLQATDYTKIKIGAKPATDIKGNTANYVLSKIPDTDRATIDTALATAVQIAHDVIAGVK